MFFNSKHVSYRLPLFAVFCVSIGLLTGCQSADQNVYGYDFNTAKITYQVSGSSVGTSEVIIKGEKKVIRNKIIQTKLDGSQVNIDTYLIQDGEKLYTLDSTNKTASVLKQPFYGEMQKITPEARKTLMIKEALRITETPGQSSELPKPEKTQEIAGQKCDYYTGGLTKTCLWEGIPLQTIASLPDYGIQTETTATKIELNQPIADSEFAVPNDYKITELN